MADERSAILWLRRELGEQPLIYQDLQPSFLRELHQAGHEQLPELCALLEESFLQDEAGRWYVPDLQGRAQDLERLREWALLAGSGPAATPTAWSMKPLPPLADHRLPFTVHPSPSPLPPWPSACRSRWCRRTPLC